MTCDERQTYLASRARVVFPGTPFPDSQTMSESEGPVHDHTTENGSLMTFNFSAERQLTIQFRAEEPPPSKDTPQLKVTKIAAGVKVEFFSSSRRRDLRRVQVCAAEQPLPAGFDGAAARGVWGSELSSRYDSAADTLTIFFSAASSAVGAPQPTRSMGFELLLDEQRRLAALVIKQASPKLSTYCCAQPSTTVEDIPLGAGGVFEAPTAMSSRSPLSALP